MLKMGVIEEAHDEQVISSNMLVVPKKNSKELRCVVDLRELNKITLPSNRRIPRIDEILNELNGGKFFIGLDVQKAFWSIKLPENQKKFYTLADPLTNQVYRYTVMPMGHKNSAQWFQCFLERILNKGNTKSFQTYIDDVNGHFDTVENALFEFEELLKCLQNAGLKIGLNKCSFLAKELPAFGFIVTREGIVADPCRIQAIEKLPVPKDSKELLSFLASLNYYRSLIPGFSQKVTNLFKMISSKSDFKWSADRQKKFKIIKLAMVKSVQ